VYKIREETVSVLLSEILEEAGVTNVSLLNIGGIPDIYLLIRGIRVIVETKEEGHRAELQKQLQGRLDNNMCDLGVGLEYPRSVVTGSLSPPTTRDVRKRLMSESLYSIALGQGAEGYLVIFEKESVRASELPELLSSVAGEILPISEVEKVIDEVRDAISYFTRNVSTLANSKYLAELIMEELELGQ
jgi:hypothetical protein